MPLRRLLVPALWVLACLLLTAAAALTCLLPSANTLTPYYLIGLLVALLAVVAPLIDRLEARDARP